MLLADRAREQFGVQCGPSPETDRLLRRCAAAYRGRPDWLDPDPENTIRTVNLAKSVCSETARLATLAVGISVAGSR